MLLYEDNLLTFKTVQNIVDSLALMEVDEWPGHPQQFQNVANRIET